MKQIHLANAKCGICLNAIPLAQFFQPPAPVEGTTSQNSSSELKHAATLLGIGWIFFQNTG